MADSEALILMASDVVSDAEMVRRLVSHEHPRVAVSTRPEAWADEFDQQRPQILILGFKSLQAAESYCLGLYRHSQLINVAPHRTLLLCHKDELRGAYELCRKDNFDDDECMRKLLSRLLCTAHCDVDEAANAVDAMAVLRKRHPDLILMDVQLPGVDGIELTRRLKRAPPVAAIPIIMLTGQREKNVIVESLAAGAADFVVKPFEREVLLKKVARCIGDFRTPPSNDHLRVSEAGGN